MTNKFPPSAYLVYIVMQKRRDGIVYQDMHKTTGRFFFTPEDAQKKLDADPDLVPHRHVVPIVCVTEAGWDDHFAE